MGITRKLSELGVIMGCPMLRGTAFVLAWSALLGSSWVLAEEPLREMNLSLVNRDQVGDEIFRRPTLDSAGVARKPWIPQDLKVLDWQKEWGTIHINSLADGLADPGEAVAMAKKESPTQDYRVLTGSMTLCHQGGDLVKWVMEGLCTAPDRDAGYPSAVMRGASSGIRPLSTCSSATDVPCSAGTMDSNFNSRFRFPLWSADQVRNFDPRQRGEQVAHGIKSDIKRSVLGCMTRHLANWPPVNSFSYSDNNVCNGGPAPNAPSANGSNGASARNLKPRIGDMSPPTDAGGVSDFYGPVYVNLPYWKPQGGEGWDERGNLGRTHGSGCPQQLYNNCARDIHGCTHADPNSILAGYKQHDQKGYRHPVTHFFSFLERVDLFGLGKATDYTKQAGQNPKSGQLQLPAEYWAYTREETSLLPNKLQGKFSDLEFETAARDWAKLYGEPQPKTDPSARCDVSSKLPCLGQREVRVSEWQFKFPAGTSPDEACVARMRIFELDPDNPSDRDCKTKLAPAAENLACCQEVVAQSEQVLYLRRLALSSVDPSSKADRVADTPVEKIESWSRNFRDSKSVDYAGPGSDLARIDTYTIQLKAPGLEGDVVRNLVVADPSRFFDLKRYLSNAPLQSATQYGQYYSKVDPITGLAYSISQKENWAPHQTYGSDSSEQARYWRDSLVATAAECPVFGMQNGYSGICDPTPDAIVPRKNANGTLRPEADVIKDMLNGKENAGCNLAVYWEKPDQMQVKVMKLDGGTEIKSYRNYPILWSGYVRNWTFITRDQYLLNTQGRVVRGKGIYTPAQDSYTGQSLLRDQILMVERQGSYCDSYERAVGEDLSNSTVSKPAPAKLRCVQYMQLSCVDVIESPSGECENYGFVDLYIPPDEVFQAKPMLASYTTMQMFNLNKEGIAKLNNPVTARRPGYLRSIQANWNTLDQDNLTEFQYRQDLIPGTKDAVTRTAYLNSSNSYQTGFVIQDWTNGIVQITGAVRSSADWPNLDPSEMLGSLEGTKSVLKDAKIDGWPFALPGGYAADKTPEFRQLFKAAYFDHYKGPPNGTSRPFTGTFPATGKLAEVLSWLQSKGTVMRLSAGQGVMARVSPRGKYTESICYKTNFVPSSTASMAKRELFVPSHTASEHRKFLEAMTAHADGQGRKIASWEPETVGLIGERGSPAISVEPCNGKLLRNDEGSAVNGLPNVAAYRTPLAGKVSLTQGSAQVKGSSGTKFRTDFKVGQVFSVGSAAGGYWVKSIQNDTELTLSKPFEGNSVTNVTGYSRSDRVWAGTKTWFPAAASKSDFSCEGLSEPATCNATAMIEVKRYCRLEDAGMGSCSACQTEANALEGETVGLGTTQNIQNDKFDADLLTLPRPGAGVAVLDGVQDGARSGAKVRFNPYRVAAPGEQVDKCTYKAYCFNKSATVCAAAKTTGGHIFCFGPDTRITMADGTELAIEKVQPGDAVLAFDALNARGGGAKEVRVKAVTRTPTQRVLKLNDTLVTPAHKFVLSTGRAVRADELKTGDRILRIDGSLEKVSSVEVQQKNMDVYNLILEDGVEGYFANGMKVLSYPDLAGL